MRMMGVEQNPESKIFSPPNSEFSDSPAPSHIRSLGRMAARNPALRSITKSALMPRKSPLWPTARRSGVSKTPEALDVCWRALLGIRATYSIEHLLQDELA
jgi:hypothetical protein